MEDESTRGGIGRWCKYTLSLAARAAFIVVGSVVLIVGILFIVCSVMPSFCKEELLASAANDRFEVRAYYTGCGSLGDDRVSVTYFDKSSLFEMEHNLVVRDPVSHVTLEFTDSAEVEVRYWGAVGDGIMKVFETEKFVLEEHFF